MGIIAALIGAFCLAAKDLVSKRVSTEVSSSVSTFASFAFALPFYFIAFIVGYLTDSITVQITQWFLILVVLRALTDCMAEWLRMVAFTHADLSLVSNFFALMPVFLLVLSPLITGDVVSLEGGLAVSLVVAGNLILLFGKTSKKKSELKGILFATLAALFFSINTCLDRLAVKESSPFVAAFSMTLLACILFSPALAFERKATEQLRSQFWFFALRGLLEIVFMVAKLWALLYLPPPYAMALVRLSLLFSVLGGHMVLKEGEFKRRMCAACIILLGTVWIIVEL